MSARHHHFCIQCGSKLENTGPVPSDQPSHQNKKSDAVKTPYASLWRRAVAYVIDWILLSPLWLTLGYLMSPKNWSSVGVAIGIGAGVFVVVLSMLCVYYAGMESSRLQATIGKLALRLRVTDMSGGRIGRRRAVRRFFWRIFSAMFLGIGFWAAAYSGKRQAFHDTEVGTLVVGRRFAPGEVAGAPVLPANWGRSTFAVASTILGMILGFFALSGLFTALSGLFTVIVTPTYHEYTIRKEIRDGLHLAERYEEAITDALAAGKSASTIFSGVTDHDNSFVSLPTSDTYVAAVQVVSGAIALQYGGAADQAINGKLVVIVPVVNSQHKTIWVCGHAKTVAGLLVDPRASRYTTVDNKYLPSECRN